MDAGRQLYSIMMSAERARDLAAWREQLTVSWARVTVREVSADRGQTFVMSVRGPWPSLPALPPGSRASWRRGTWA